MDSAPIQTQPAGLLGFLQLKNMGQNPSVLPDRLQPILEMFEWYMQSSAEILQQAGSAFTTAGVKVIHTVPAGEWWVVDDFQAVATIDVGGSLEAAPCYQTPGFGLGHLIDELRTFAVAGGNAPFFMPRDNRPLLLPPGSTLGLFVRNVAVGVTVLVGNVRFARLKI